MGLFVKIVPWDFNNASRDKKELSVVRELGHEVIVVARDKKRINEIDSNEGWVVHYRTTRPFSQNWFLTINRLLSIFTWAKYVRGLKANYVSGHNLTGLLVAWISTWFQSPSTRPILIYDAHEFEAALYEKRSRITRFCMIHLERFLINKAALSIVVNNTIADEVQKLHKLVKRPLVIRNIPHYWEINAAICRERREEYYAEFNFEIRNDVFLVMYHGGFIKERGIENLIRAIAKLENVAAIILGDGEFSYIQTLYDLVKQEGVENKVIFHPAVPNKVLWQYIGAVDLGVCILSNSSKNHFYALPNKLFENIQAETPVIGSDFPEISRIINQYKIGLTCDPHNINDIASLIKIIKNDTEGYKIFKANLKTAKNDLCWENERHLLKSEYTRLLV